MTTSTAVMDMVIAHFNEMLMPRNHGLIGITSIPHDRHDKRCGFIVALGVEPFLEIQFKEASIRLVTGFPYSIAVWSNKDQEWQPNPNGSVKVLSTRPKLRSKELTALKQERIRHVSGEITFDLFDPDTLQKSEFYVHSMITRMKYAVSNTGYGGFRTKDGFELTDLIAAATVDYDKKIRKLSNKG